ncbi:MAG: lipoate--protein ligase family protein [Candidatus Riflebacteria bacterium]|nr:lipoate--protein ligase family protein [Candidatus Riflebacteria bacterium]
MAETWRLIVEDSDDPVFHLASLEAVWRSLDEGPAPETLVLRRLSPCVLLGTSQEAAREVNLRECRKREIPVLRRPSEGGAIYCDRDCLLFSIVCRRCGQSGDSPVGVLEAWGGVIVKALQRLGMAREASFAGPNDITLGGKKVAGLTMTDWYGIRSVSGAVLIDADLETMGAVLTPGAEKLGRHGADRIGDRVTTLRQWVKPPLTTSAVADALIATVGAERSISFRHEPLVARDLEAAEMLRKHKYGNPAWNRTEIALEEP